jgi:hypothetical protein
LDHPDLYEYTAQPHAGLSIHLILTRRNVFRTVISYDRTVPGPGFTARLSGIESLLYHVVSADSIPRTDQVGFPDTHDDPELTCGTTVTPYYTG